MVRTLQTTRVNTNYVPPPRQVPVYHVVVEEIPMDLPRLRVDIGVILDDNSEELLPTPTPLAESLAFAAGSSASAPPAPAVQAPAPEGDDPDDSGDDDEDDNDEEDDEENVNKEADGVQQDYFMGSGPITEHYTSMFETGHFPNLLQDTLLNKTIGLESKRKELSDHKRKFQVSALIDEKILCMHGGLSPELNKLEQILNLNRPTDVPDTGLLCDLLWSDPSNEATGWAINDRGVSFTFGPDKVSEFLEKHDLDLICRAHQVVVFLKM
eukprot:XP_020401752.1 uncharacterized protein LOC109943262 [Zea mays]